MEKFDLSDKWEFCGFDRGEGLRQRAFEPGAPGAWKETSVPGVVHLDLLRQGLIPDPFYRANELAVRWVEEKEWWYRKTFEVEEAFFYHKFIQLAAEGLDTFATVYLNGREVGCFDNMFIEHRRPVKDYLKPGPNTLAVCFDSPTRHLEEIEQNSGKLISAFYSARPYGRKAQYAFGWDWGPRLATSGIWQPINLEAFDFARIVNIFPKVITLEEKTAEIILEGELEVFVPGSEASLSLTIGLEEKNTTKAIPAPLTEPGLVKFSVPFTLAEPQLWWPAGMGGQPLYTCTEALSAGGKLLEEKSLRFGLREVKLLREPEADGESFVFEINHTPIFCKGANWIPADSFLPAIDRARYDRLLTQAVAANMNMLRVWGGGIYEPEDFYDLCDEKGILVWQDFMFACAEYPENEAFHRQVRQEAEAVVRRLRPHPSVALWCGNNENDSGYETEWKYKRDQFLGRTIYHEILPQICDTLDGTRPYWPGSPYGGKNNNGEERGDRHAWEVWWAWQDYPNYRADRGRFLSEFGMQSYPTMETIAAFTEPQDRDPQSEIIEFYNKMPEGPPRLFRYLTGHLRLPKTFEEFIVKTQIIQGLALTCGIEHWRTRKFQTSGTLFWQLNDCWPGASWSVLDCRLNPKASYYYVKRAFAPLHIIPMEEGDNLALYVINDTLKALPCRVEAALITLTGERKWQAELELTARPNAAQKVGEWSKAEIGLQSPKEEIFFARLLPKEGTTPYADNLLLFTEIKYLPLLPPEISVVGIELKEGGAEIILAAKTLALALEVGLEGIKAEWEDNFINLAPGIPKNLRVKLPEPLPVEQIKSALKFTHYLP